MKNVSTSVLIFGIYHVVAGLSFLFVPNVVLGVLTIPAANEAWVHVVGLIVLVVGLYDIQAYRDNNHAYFKMTIWGRVVFAVGITIIALVTPNHMPLVLFSVINLAGAAWTWYASQQQVQLAKA
jgi:uncharacterized membrane protein HdeD (DUF308 family)